MTGLRVLVTGAGSGVGQAIIKALKLSSLAPTVIAADIAPYNAGLYRTNESLLIPKVEEEGSLVVMMDRIKKSKTNIIMVGSEFELDFFAENKETIEEETKAKVVVSPKETVKISNDKWLTVKFLEERNLPHPYSACPKNLEEALEMAKNFEYPFILKTRQGTSSRHVHIIENQKALIQHFSTVPRPLLQELIQRPSNELSSEYTCSIFKTKEGDLLGPFTARRTLRGGNSWVVEVAPFEEIYPLLFSIGKHLPMMGSTNVQLMKSSTGYIPFELNARFSGTTAVRAHYGFNEPEMVLRNYFLNEKLENPSIRKGMAFRYLEEVFVEGLDEKELSQSFPKGIVRRWF